MPHLSLYDQALAEFTTSVRQTRIKDGDADGERQLKEFLTKRATPQEAQESARSLSVDAGKKYGSKKIGDKVIIPQKWIDNVIGNINNFIAVGNKLMAGAPETVSAAWFVVKIGLGAIQQNYALYSLFGSGLTAMTEIMILIPHYDTVFDQRDKAGYKVDDITQKLFRDIVACYAAVLDFLFSIKRHIEATGFAKARHALKDAFGSEAAKFKGKQDAVLALKAKVLEDSEAAFKGKIFDQMGDVQESLKATLGDISSFNATAKELAQSQSDILDSLQDIKTLMKPKSRWDILKQDFDAHVKILDPYQADTDIVAALLEKRQADTCTWLSEDETALEWWDLNSPQLICLTGREGVGKSILGATIVNRLVGDLASDDNMICHFSCTTSDNDVADLGKDPAQTIRNSLLYQVYKTFAEDDQSEDSALLDEANKLFHQQKKTDKQKSVAGLGPDVTAPPFVTTMFKLLDLAKVDFVLVIDGIDRLPKKDQLSLLNDFSELVLERDNQCRVVAICRTGQPFSIAAQKSYPAVNVEDNNDDDIAAVLDAALQAQRGLTPQERDEAKAKVVEMAGGSFAYVTDLAIPFLEQPFQRPLSNRLKAMPGGIMDTYKQALKSMSPAYVDLLRTALLWTLYADEPVRIHEIMEAHTGVYLTDVDMGKDEDYSEVQASELEVSQLEEASGPFLRTWRDYFSNWHAGPKDIVQIRKFCSAVTEESSHDHVLCSNCSRDVSSSTELALSDKDAHLKMCIALLKHLNSPLFQKRFGLHPDSVPSATGEPDAEESKDYPYPRDWSFNSVYWQDLTTRQLRRGHPESEPVAEEDNNETGTEEPSKEEVPPHANGEATISTGEKQPVVTTDHEPGAAAIDSGLVEADEQPDQPEGDVGDLSDGSHDSEDEDNPNVRAEQEGEAQGSDDNRFALRYEIEEISYHLCMAEQLWSRAEKEQSAEWQELIDLLDKFALDTPLVFQAWCRAWEFAKPNNDLGGHDPLNVAARIGAYYWAEHLVRDKGLDPNAAYNTWTPLLALVAGPQSREALKYFLSLPGLDLDALNGNESTYRWPITQRWLQLDGSAETVQILIDAGADFSKMAGGSNALHHLSWGIQEPEVLSLFLSAPTAPDINVKRDNGNTPLHHLLMRNDVTPELVNAYLKAGADVDAENEESVMPLDQACWNCREDIVLILLEHGLKDINDKDAEGRTALSGACSVGDLGTIRALIKHGADMEAKTTRGRTCLDVACWDNQPVVVEELIKLNANLLNKDRHGRGPMFWSCYVNNTPEVAKIVLAALKEKKADIQEINRPTFTKRSPLRMAATHGFVEIVKDLLDLTEAAGLPLSESLDLQDTRHGDTALHRAAVRGEVETVKLLIERGADATLENKEGKTPLMLACDLWQTLGSTKFEEIVCSCIPVDIAHTKANSDLPAIAATNDSVKILQQLAHVGISLNDVDSFGWTPLLLAQRLQLTEVERFLRSHTAWKANLPTIWVKHSSVPDGFTVNEDGLSMTYTLNERFAITTDRPLPGHLDRFYFEITITKPEDTDAAFGDNPEVAIGFSTHSGIAYDFPGWDPKRTVRNGFSWAQHGDTGHHYFRSNDDGVKLTDGFGPGDTVGAGIDLQTQTMWYTKNGKKLEYEPSDVKGRLFPILGLNDNVQLTTNFGAKPFMWDEQAVIEEAIEQIAESLNEVELGAEAPEAT